MRTRLAACETCRRSKLACDHERPACARCRHRGLRAGCIYRDRPFQRNTQRSSPRNSVSATASSPHAREFPGSGFVDQIPSGIASVNINWNDDDLLHGLSTSISQGILQDQGLVDRASRTLNQLIIVDIPKLHRLVFAWLDKKVNLPLAEPFVSGSADATLYLGNLLSSTSTAVAVRSGDGQLSSTWFSQHASWLLKNTRHPISLEREMTANAFLSQMLGNNLRWETLGIFFTAAARAAIDTVSFPSLYNNDQERNNLIKTLTSMGDWCLETCLSLDCLNDIQLILQYENFIVHSQVDGEQSYHSWRRMGDVASSLFALGYHEEIDEEAANIPIFVAELRRAVFARAYAADKSLAVFLGRPSRISRSYCTLQLPKNIPRIWNDETALENLDPGLPEIINYTSDTCCSARFASLKEDVLELFRHRSSGSETDQARSIIRQATEVQWQSMPAHFKLTTGLRDCHLEPFERDFLVSRRLDYLHIFFLLHLISLKQITEPNEGILTVAGEMLSYAVEVVILRDRLVNSGTSIIFKVAQYGLPAAGIISLALLNNTVGTNRRPCSRSKFVQGLSVLVAGIRTGGVIQDGDPNFALFFQASRAIQSLLDFLMDWGPPQVGQPSSQHYSTFNPSDYWGSSAGFGPWHFDFEFWSKLAKHPNLLGHGHGA